MDPWLEDHTEGVEALLSAARKRTVEANNFRRAIHQHPDLVHGSSFPETDEDIIASIILRFLHDHIFQAVLYGTLGHYIDNISFIENHMQMSVQPKRGTSHMSLDFFLLLFASFRPLAHANRSIRC